MLDECLVKPASHCATRFAWESLVVVFRLGDVTLGRRAGISFGIFVVVFHGDDIEWLAMRLCGVGRPACQVVWERVAARLSPIPIRAANCMLAIT